MTPERRHEYAERLRQTYKFWNTQRVRAALELRGEIMQALPIWLFGLTVRLKRWTCKHEYEMTGNGHGGQHTIWCKKCGWNEKYE